MSRISIVATGTLVGLIAFVIASIVAFGEQLGPLYLTGPSVLLGTFILTMGWLVAAYSARNLRGQARQSRYAALLALAISMLWLAVVANPIVLTALGWTVSGLAIAGLVAHANTASAHSASKRVAGRLLIGDAALWAGVVLMLAQGTAVRSDLAAVGWMVPALLAISGIVPSALVPACSCPRSAEERPGARSRSPGRMSPSCPTRMRHCSRCRHRTSAPRRSHRGGRTRR